jgi:hypothetical protein
MRQRARTLSGYFLLILFVSYYGNISLFIHAHEINGKHLLHSHLYHPALDGNKPDHQHATSSLNLIHSLTHFYSTGLFAHPESAVLQRLITCFNQCRQKDIALKLALIQANGWRASPVQLHV